jgi:tetratricopeptide (TPR) repeat protein
MNYLFLARYEEAIKEAREGIRLRPTAPTPRSNLIVALLAMGRFDEAAEANKELATSSPNSVVTAVNNLFFAFLRGDRETMNALISESRGTPEEGNFVSFSAATALYLGQSVKGEEETRISVDLLVAEDRKETAAQNINAVADAQAVFGKCGEARHNVRRALELSRTKTILVSAALVLAECGDQIRAESLLEEAIKKSPQDTVTVLLSQPVIRAVIETDRGNYTEAIKILETIRPYDFGTLTGAINNYARGQAYLKLKSGSEAAAEFQTIIDRRGVDPFNPKRVLSYLGLARAATLAGDASRSQKAYQDFFTLWKEAEQDLPVLIEAKKEFQLLQR